MKPATDSVKCREWIGVLPAGLVSLLPFVIWHSQFTELFWFGDEWDLLDQIDRTNLWHWTWTVFAENFVPLFKLLWGGAVLLGGGSYFLMLVLLWLTHAANTALLGRLLRRAGNGWFVVVFCQVVFALCAANIETLAWTVQWSAVLATTFLLLGLDGFLAAPQPSGRRLSWLAVCTAGSALCFSRGVLTGAVLALACLLPEANRFSRPSARQLFCALLCLLPAIITAAVIILFASGNHQHPDAGRFWSAANYALWYFCLNPLHRLVEVDSWGPRTVAFLGLAKLALVAWCLWRSCGTVRTLLILLLAFDLGNSALLGLGRFHTGLETTISSRYQYGALLAGLPFLAIWLESLGRLLPSWARTAAASLLLLGAGWYVMRAWPIEARTYAAERGSVARRLLTEPQSLTQDAVPGIPSMSTTRAKELAARFDLH